jgi:hypothetical protein
MEVAATEKVTTATDKQTNNDPREKEGSFFQKGKEQLPKSQGKKECTLFRTFRKSVDKVRNKGQKQTSETSRGP